MGKGISHQSRNYVIHYYMNPPNPKRRRAPGAGRPAADPTNPRNVRVAVLISQADLAWLRQQAGGNLSAALYDLITAARKRSPR